MATDPRVLQQFMTNAAVKLPGSSESGIKAELFDVFKEFFEDSNCWFEDIQFQAVAAQTDYPLTPAENGQIIRLAVAWTDQGTPVGAFMPVFGTVKLLHAPQTTPAAKWTARVIKTVSVPTTRENVPIVPDWALGVYSIHVMDGLLGKMMAQPNKSYSNQNLSAYHLKRFRTGIQIARVAALRANLVGAQEWSYPRNGWGPGTQRRGISTAFPTGM